MSILWSLEFFQDQLQAQEPWWSQLGSSYVPSNGLCNSVLRS